MQLGTLALLRTVNVVDTTAPVLTIVGDNPATVELGSTYTDAGATATDLDNVTITTTSDVDTDIVGHIQFHIQQLMPLVIQQQQREQLMLLIPQLLFSLHLLPLARKKIRHLLVQLQLLTFRQLHSLSQVQILSFQVQVC